MYKVYCPTCNNRMIDANKYVFSIYYSGSGKEVEYRCPACKEIFKKEEATK